MNNKHIWEGWTVQDFINNLEPMFKMIQSGNSWKKPFKDSKELKTWCMENQPYYKNIFRKFLIISKNKYENLF